MSLVVGKNKHVLFSYSIIDSALGEVLEQLLEYLPEQSEDLSEVISLELETGQASPQAFISLADLKLNQAITAT
jgi:hypothetical protein